MDVARSKPIQSSKRGPKTGTTASFSSTKNSTKQEDSISSAESKRINKTHIAHVKEPKSVKISIDRNIDDYENSVQNN